ncbi:uncharacterized protein VTP21DRAFT_6560 [Calcarisporiella thermophila]|uniref:uncharacterized protein n=1 Tax=Calcarisporiella thermophila TaxID=911321 RepID=UPI00374425D4
MSFPEGYFFIRNVFSGKVLDVKDHSKKEGANIILWHRKSLLNDNQLWKYEDGYIINKETGFVLEVQGGIGGGNLKPGSDIVQAKRREPPTSINQLWAYNYEYLQPFDPKVCLAVHDNKFDDGTKIVVTELIDFPNNIKQQWQFDEV